MSVSLNLDPSDAFEDSQNRFVGVVSRHIQKAANLLNRDRAEEALDVLIKLFEKKPELSEINNNLTLEFAFKAIDLLRDDLLLMEEYIRKLQGYGRSPTIYEQQTEQNALKIVLEA